VSFPESQYKVILSLRNGTEEEYTYTQQSTDISLVVGQLIEIGGRGMTITDIEPAIPGKKVGVLRARARLPTTP